MKTLLTIQSSLFSNDGQSSVLVEHFVQNWLATNPRGQVVTRDLAKDPVPHLDAARFQAFLTPAKERSSIQQEAAKCSDELIDEIANSDTIVIAAPMYNFSVPSTLKAYFDHIARSGITFRYTENGPEGLLKGRKAYVIVTRGGFYGENHSQTSYVQQFLNFIGISDVEFILAEGQAMDEKSKYEAMSSAISKIEEFVRNDAKKEAGSKAPIMW